MSQSVPPNYLTEQFDIQPDFAPFNQKYDIFNRSVWDEKVDAKKLFVSYDIANYSPKKSKGFDHWDYAFRNASWHLTDAVGERDFARDGRVEGFTDYYSLGTEGPKEAVRLDSPESTARRIKIAAKMFGAGLVGICRLDRRWIYSHHFNRLTGENPVLDLPAHFRYAIMLAIPMDYELGKTFPSALSGATTGIGYAGSLQCAVTLAQFIVNLGYDAVASMNDTGLNVPMAIEAGLGEYGRLGLLITKEYGPNVRLAKVFTDLPLAPDHPIEFGVKAFCQICRKCSSACPARAIPAGEPQSEPPNHSSLTRIRKWTVDAERCFRFWVGMNTDCAICIRVCPYNKDYRKWWNRLGIRLAHSPLRRLMLWLDGAMKFGKRMDPAAWWKKKEELL